MKVLFKLTDKDIGMPEKEVQEYKIRNAARGIVINQEGKIALQAKSNTKKQDVKLI